MIISKTPYRISFFGGGTDFPEWYNYNKGAVISATINKYSYITIKNLHNFHDYKIRVRYYLREEAKNIKHIQHPVIKKYLKLIKFKDNLEIIHHGDLPARSGIGSSSSFSVGLIHTMNSFLNKKISKRNLTLKTLHLEHKILKESCGSQDQVAAVYGGFNKITFNSSNQFHCKRLPIPKKNLKTLENWIQLFYTNKSRESTDLEKDKIKNLKKNKEFYERSYQLVIQAEKLIKSKNKNFIIEFCNLLNEQWDLKKKLSKKVSNKSLDNLYKIGIQNGALGGKILGAGAGGFMLFLTPPKYQKNLEKIIKLPSIKIKFETVGSQVIFK